MWDGQLRNHTYRLLFKHGVSPSSATLRECQMNQMPSRSYQLPPPENWRRPSGRPVVRGWRLFSRTWNQWTCPWTKQSTWLRIVHSAGWCLRLALRTQSGACQKRTNECLIRVVELLSCCVDRSANKRYYAGQPSVKPDWSSSVLPGVPWLPVHSEVDMLQHFFNNSRNIYTQQWCTIISSRAGAI